MDDDTDLDAGAGSETGEGPDAAAAAATAADKGGESGGEGGQATSWVDGLDDASRQTITAKGYKSPNDLARAYRELEGKIGLDKVVLPKDDADEKAWDEFYAAKGRPEAADKYSFKLPEGMDEPTEVDSAFQKHIAPFVHKAGLSQRELDHLAEGFNSFTQQVEQQKLQANEAMMAEVKTEWGANYDRNVEIAKRAVTALGADAGVLDDLEDIVKSGPMLRLFHKIGSELVGGSLVTDDGSGGGGMPTSPEQAQAEIKKIQSASSEDPQHPYRNKKHPEYAAMTQRMMDLHKIAYPDSAGG